MPTEPGQPAFSVVEQTFDVAGRQWHLRTLEDRQQFFDPDGRFEAAGIAPAMWSLFGVIWPAGLQLAGYMAHFPLEGRRILEAGCGLALASMVVHARGGNIIASDIHPLAGEFLEHNLALNDLTGLEFRVMDWRDNYALDIDLIIGSDLLYEREQPELLAGFVHRHLPAGGELILTDPGRGQVAKFNRLMRASGFDVSEAFSGKSRLGHYRRST